MSSTEKKFDAVAMMRAARDKMSAEIEGMTLEEELKWLASQEIKDPFLKRLERLKERVGPATIENGVQVELRFRLQHTWDRRFLACSRSLLWPARRWFVDRTLPAVP